MHPNQQQATRNKQHAPRHPKRPASALPNLIVRQRRGSILIFVVALLTLIALIGTALIATSRIDRVNTQAHVDTASQTAFRNAYADALRQKVFSTLLRGFGHDVDSARTDPWLGDRIPSAVPNTIPVYTGSAPFASLNSIPAAQTPMWRFYSGILDANDAELADPARWQPPLQFSPNNPVSLLNLTNPALNLVKLGSNNMGASLVPSSISITYPTDHPVDAVRGQTRTFPAAYFVHNPTRSPNDPTNINAPSILWGPNNVFNAGYGNRPALAADADGDGIADSVLFRLSNTPVDGVSVYGAVRIIDNNSAINVNTAWLRSADFAIDPANPTTIPPLYTNTNNGLNQAYAAPALHPSGFNNGFFPSNIGLLELLDPYAGYIKTTGSAEGGGRQARDNELAELDEYRLGYPISAFDTTNGTDKGGWIDAFEEYTNNGAGSTRTKPSIQDMFVSRNSTGNGVLDNRLTALEDVSRDPGSVTNPSNAWNPDPDGANANSDVIGNFAPDSGSGPSTGRSASLVRPDFAFLSQNEALFTMASRRWLSIRYGTDIRPNIPSLVNNPSSQASVLPTATPFNVDKAVGDYQYSFPSAQITGLSQELHGLFPYRWLDEEEAASLAYRFCMIDPAGNPSTLDTILRHSAYRAAPNYKYGISDSNTSYTSLPANEFVFWFQALNFDLRYDGSRDTSQDVAVMAGNDPWTQVAYPPETFYTEIKSFADKATGANNPTASGNGNQSRFRSVRPLLTTHNPVNTSALARSYVYDNLGNYNYPTADFPNAISHTFIDWYRNNNPATTLPASNIIYPGMIFNDMVNTGNSSLPFKTPAPYLAGGQNGQYQVGDFVYNPVSMNPPPQFNPATRVVWMLTKSLPANTNIAPWETANIDTLTGEYKYWEPQPWVSGWNKTSINTAGFPELWHAFYLTMSSGVNVSPFDSAANSEVLNVLKLAGGSTIPNQNTDLGYFFPLPDSTPPLPGAQSPFNSYGDANTTLVRFYDPYRGMRFTLTDGILLGRPLAATGLPNPTDNTAAAAPDKDPSFDGAPYNYPETSQVGNPPQPNPELNTLAMFRSVIRDPRFIRPDAGAPDADNPDTIVTASDAGNSITNAPAVSTSIKTIERLTPYQMMTLRSAIAAFNAQDMLNVWGLRENAANSAAYDPNDVPAKTIILYDINQDLPNPTSNNAANETNTQYPSAKNPRPQYEVTIYANRPQPFITEVYANNDNSVHAFQDPKDVDPNDSTKTTAKAYQNPNGYVAIELYNPYDVPITMTNWQIGAINRSATATPPAPAFGTATNLITGPGGTGSPIAIPNGTAVPAHGRLVIESYDPAINKNGNFDPADPTNLAQPFATRQFRPPSSAIMPLWNKLGDDAEWYNFISPTSGYDPGPGTVALSVVDPSGQRVEVQNLISIPAIAEFLNGGGRELVILRPRKVSITSPQPQDMVPVDQFDFTGAKAPNDTYCQTFHYARNDVDKTWQCVYPGRYDAGRAEMAARHPTANDSGPRRQQGVWVTPRIPEIAAKPPAQANTYNPTTEYDPWMNPQYTSSTDPAILKDDRPFLPAELDPTGRTDLRFSGVSFYQQNVGSPGGTATFVSTLSIPLLGGPFALNPLTPQPINATKVKVSPNQTLNQFPFGGFARNGDMLQVPFIAAYRIRKLVSEDTANFTTNGINPGKQAFPVGVNTPGPILEMNSISADAALAEDTNPNNNLLNGENVGRMANLNIQISNATLAALNVTPYSWTSNLFRYLDVHVPANDYLPDVNPNTYPPGSPLTSAAGNYGGHKLAKAVANRPGTPDLSINSAANPTSYPELTKFTPTDETNTTTQGLINLNTAPAKVLSMLPIVANPANGQVDDTKTRRAAQDIFDWVSSKGDITSLFDLNKVNNIAGDTNNGNAYIKPGTDLSKAGDVYPKSFGPPPANTPQVDDFAGGFKQQYLIMNRLSNLVTTKSDTFTVYLLVQGWREAGTQFPALDWEVRQAYIVDRSTGTIRATKVPTD